MGPILPGPVAGSGADPVRSPCTFLAALCLGSAGLAGAGCASDGGFDSGDDPQPCQGGAPSSTWLEASGSLLSPSWRPCVPPAPPEGTQPEQAPFQAQAGPTAVAAGGSVAWLLAATADAESVSDGLLLSVAGEEGYFEWGRFPAVDTLEQWTLTLFVSPQAPDGVRVLSLAGVPASPVDGEVTAAFSAPLEVVAAQGGDVQVSAAWDTPTDVDLIVVDPVGERLGSGAVSVGSGGVQDVLSPTECAAMAPAVESLAWPTGRAPGGEYLVLARYADRCDLYDPTEVRVTVRLAGTETLVLEAEFQPGEVDTDPSGGVWMGSFVWPPASS